VDYCCGSCGARLAEGVDFVQIRNFVLQCANCDAYNDALGLSLN
jgi:hypothetical protein